MLSVVYFRLTGSFQLMLLTTVGQWLERPFCSLCPEDNDITEPKSPRGSGLVWM